MDRYMGWAVGAWLAGLCGISYWLWGAVLWTTPWGLWARAFGEAAAGVPGVLLHGGALWGLVVLAAAAVGGRSVVARLLPEGPVVALSVGVGLVGLALLGVALGSVGLYKPSVLVALVLAMLVLGCVDLFREHRLDRLRLRSPYPLGPLEIAGLVFCGAIVFITALNPTLFYDALYYHLSLPRYYLFAGNTEPVAWHTLSYFPSNMEMLHGIAIAGGGGMAAQVMMAGVWFFSVLMVRSLAARFIGPEAGPWALLAALGSVTFALSALLVISDIFVLLLAAGGLYCLCGASEAAGKKEFSAFGAWLVCWGIMAGGAAGIKYTAWITVLGLQGLLVAWLAARTFPRGVRGAAAGLALALLTLLPWMLRNYLSCGNPVMPAPVDGLFAGVPAPVWAALKRDAHEVSWSLPALAANLASPWTMVFSRWQTLLSDWGEASYIGPLIWMGAPLTLLFRRELRAPRLLWVYGLAALAVSIGMIRITRYAYPGLGALAAVAGGGLAAWRMAGGERKWARYAGSAALAAAAVLCAAVLLRTSANLSDAYRFPRVSGDMARYMEYRVEKSAFEAATVPLQLAANHKLPPDAVVLLVGEARSFYLDREAVSPSFLDRNPLLDLLGRGSDESAALSLRRAGITHVLAAVPEIARLSKKYGILPFNPAVERRVREFTHGPWCRPVLEDEKAGAVICELKAAAQE